MESNTGMVDKNIKIFNIIFISFDKCYVDEILETLNNHIRKSILLSKNRNFRETCQLLRGH